MPTNDNDLATPGATPRFPDAHGQAALVLVESLIHGLCEKAILSTNDAVEILERAVDVQLDHAETGGSEATTMWQSHALLLSIANSLSIDGKGGPPPVTPV